ncbi:PTS fructose transporter subunit IIC [Enterococcus hirae]|nr:PTS fructose transporter subunit IIC [Enterococcus hirae]
MKKVLNDLKQSLLTGVSFMLPFVTGGGILIALAFAIGGIYVGDAKGTFGFEMFGWGKTAFGLMIPVLGGYIAYSLADKPAIAPGFVAGMIASTQGSGFIGAMIGGILAGYVVRELKKIKLPYQLRSLLTTLIIPLVSIFIMGILMSYVIGKPITWLNTTMNSRLSGMSGGSLILLGLIQGAMLAFDMGGPLNKAAYAFAIAASAGNNWSPMAANFIASMAPPLGIAIAMLISKKKFSEVDRDGIGGCFIGGCAMITEFAIPYAVKDPFRVIPSLIVGSSIGAALSYAAGLTLRAPHGGLFVIFLCNKPLIFLGILLLSACITATMLIFLKKNIQAVDTEN